MNGLPYYRRHPRDFIEGTVGMPFDEKAAYGLVLDYIYLHNGNLPDDARYISGLLSLSVRKWNSIRESLLERRKLQVSGDFLTNYRAINELITLGKYQDKQSQNGSIPKKLKALPKPEPKPDRSHTDTDTDTEGEEGLSNDNPPPPVGGGGFSDEDFDKLLTAVGYDPDGHIPFTWEDLGKAWAAGWVERGLTPDRIVAAAKESRSYHPEAPATPQALDKAMDRALASPAKDAVRATPRQMMEFWAEKVNSGGFVASSSINPVMARAMVDAGLVTPEKLKERGIAA